MSTYLPTGSTNLLANQAAKTSTGDISDALKRAKEIAAKLTGKVIPTDSDVGHKRSVEDDDVGSRETKRPLMDSHEGSFDPFNTSDVLHGSAYNFDAAASYAAVAPSQLKTTIEFIVPGYKVGLIIGTRGETLKRIERDTDTRITFDPLTTANPADMPERLVMITGLPDDCERSKKLVLEKVNGPTAVASSESFIASADPMDILKQMPVFKDAFGQPLPSVHFMIPNSKVGLVIGKGGETIRDLQERSGAKMFIAPDSTTVPNQQERLIMIAGSDDQISLAKQFLEQVLESGTPNVPGLTSAIPAKGQSQLVLIVPDNVAGLLIGKRGDYFKLMTSQSRAKIVIDPPVSNGSPTRTLTIIGAPESIAIAQQMVHEKLAPSCRLEGNAYLSNDSPSYYPTASYYPTGSTYHGTTSYQPVSASYYGHSNQVHSATALTSSATSASVPANLTREQIDYYYAYYYDYYVKAGLDSAAAIQAALSAMAAAGIPYPVTQKSSEDVHSATDLHTEVSTGDIRTGNTSLNEAENGQASSEASQLKSTETIHGSSLTNISDSDNGKVLESSEIDCKK